MAGLDIFGRFGSPATTFDEEIEVSGETIISLHHEDVALVGRVQVVGDSVDVSVETSTRVLESSEYDPTWVLQLDSQSGVTSYDEQFDDLCCRTFFIKLSGNGTVRLSAILAK